MPQPGISLLDTLSSTDNVTFYTGTAGLSFRAGRLYLMFYRGTRSGTIPDPTVTLATAGTAWTKLKTDSIGLAATGTGLYAFISAGAVTDTWKIDWGASGMTGVDVIVFEITRFWNTGTLADTFLLSDRTAGSDTTPTASLASPPPANALTIGFVVKDATTGFSRGANFSSSVGTASHSNPPSRAAAEFDNGTPQQTADWTIPAAVQWWAYVVGVKFDELHSGLATTSAASATSATRTKGGRGASSVSVAGSATSTGDGAHPGVATLATASAAAVTGKKSVSAAASSTTTLSSLATASEGKSGAATLTAAISMLVESLTGHLGVFGQIAPPDVTVPVPEEWQQTVNSTRLSWDPVTKTMFFVGEDFRLYPVSRLGDRLVPLPRVDLMTSLAFSDMAHGRADPSIDVAGRRLFAPFRHIQDSPWPVAPEALTQHLMVVDLDLTARRAGFVDERTFAQLPKTEMIPVLPEWQPGDVMVIAFSAELGTAEPDVTISSGWRQLFQKAHPSYGFGRYVAWYRVMQPNDTAPTISWSQPLNPVGVAATYRGADQLSPIASYGWATGTGTTATRPGVTPSTRNNRVAGIYFTRLAQPWTLDPTQVEIRRAEQDGILGAAPSVLMTEEEDLASLGMTHPVSATIPTSQPWAAFTVTLRPGPVTVTRLRRDLGVIRHEAVTPQGDAFALRIGDWEALESAAGGYISAKGTILSDLRHPLPDGTILRSIHHPTGEVVWAGRALDPATRGLRGELTAEGFGLDADTVLERVLWQNADTTSWQELGSEDFDAPSDDDKITIDVGPTRIKMSVVEGVELSGGEKNGGIFGAYPESVNRLSFTVKAKGSNSNWVIRVYGGAGPTYDASTWQQFGSDISLASYSSPFDVDIELPEAPELVAIVLQRKAGASTGSVGAYWVRAVKPKVNGRADGDEYSSSQMARDLFDLLGISTAGVQEVGGNALPRDVASQQASQILNDLAVLADAWWGIFDTGARAYGAFDRWGSTAWWVPTGRGIYPIPQRRYDSVGVPFRSGSSAIQGLAVVDAPYQLAKSRMFTASLPGDLPDEDTAYAIAAALAPFMVSQHFAGDGSLTDLIGTGGTRWSAHRAHCGHVLHVPGYVESFRFDQLRRRDRGIDVVFPDPTSQISSLVARTVALVG